MAVCCALILAGCASTDLFRPVWPNPTGRLFRDRNEVLAEIPVGTLIRDAQAVMLRHGYQQWESRSHEDDRVVVYYPWHAGRLPSPLLDPSVTFHLCGDVVTDVTFTDPRAPQAGRP